MQATTVIVDSDACELLPGRLFRDQYYTSYLVVTPVHSLQSTCELAPGSWLGVSDEKDMRKVRLFSG